MDGRRVLLSKFVLLRKSFDRDIYWRMRRTAQRLTASRLLHTRPARYSLTQRVSGKMDMKAYLAGLAVMVAAVVPQAAMADDPNDPAMRSAAARARDRAIIQKLNRDQLAYVRKRDAEYAKDWAAYRAAQGQGQGRGQGRYAPQSDYEETAYDSTAIDARRDAANYEQSRRQYEQDLAAWRHAVTQCRKGYYEYCAR